MILKIKFVCDEVDGFLREIAIDSEATFLDLNKIVLESCGYGDDQMTSFYICNHDWERKEQVTREDMGVSNIDDDVFVMDSTRLSEFLDDKGQRLEYVFDPFSDRSFYLSVSDVDFGEELKAPKILRAKGNAPKQIAELDFSLSEAQLKGAVGGEAEMLEEDGLDDAFGYNDDELDMEGFEISDDSMY
ncbi:MAG: hypothetical protein IJ553_01545 [Alloprevotella sp.]|nr:hypothetical protein [Alloprevotella sp.]